LGKSFKLIQRIFVPGCIGSAFPPRVARFRPVFLEKLRARRCGGARGQLERHALPASHNVADALKEMSAGGVSSLGAVAESAEWIACFSPAADLNK
jgi:hypothetical protein